MFSKYNANGNDFVIFKGEAAKKGTYGDLARRVCDRQKGIGADGLIAILPKNGGEVDFEWDFYNSDGSIAEMCGNGSRAAAMWAYENLIANKNMRFLTLAGVINAKILALNPIKSQNCKNAKVEILFTKPKKLGEKFADMGREWYFYDTGVPHLVSFTEDLSEFNIALARAMREKYNANVNFAKLGEKIAVRTYERGVEGETLACGTGMAACFYASLLEQNADILSNQNAKVSPSSGDELSFALENGEIYYSGVVVHSFDCEFLG